MGTTQRARRGVMSGASRGALFTHCAVLVLLPLLAFGLYARALDGPFVIDDWNSIVYNPKVRTPPSLREFLQSNRPLTELSLAVDHHFGGLQPRQYHATNILLHGLNGILVYALLYWTVRRGTIPSTGLSPFRSPSAIASAGALLFVVHPLQTESVAYISSRSELLAACFYLLTVLLYVLAVTTSSRLTRFACVATLPLSTAAALASKEMAATIPVALLLYERCFLAAGAWRRTRDRWLLAALTLLPFGLGVPFFWRTLLVSEGAGLTFASFTPWQYLLSQFGVVLHYLQLALVPVGLNFDYDWPLARSPWALGVVLPFAILTTLAVFAVLRMRRDPIFAFAILWVLLVLAPTSSIIPIADLVAERRMYLPLVGLAFVGSAWAWDLGGWVRARRRLDAAGRGRTYALLVALLAGAFAALTVSRAATWGDAQALYEDGVAKAPHNPRARLNLGVIYLNLDRLDPALSEMREAQRLSLLRVSTHAHRDTVAFLDYNLGVVLSRLGESAEASVHLERVLRRGGRYPELRPGAEEQLRAIRREWRAWPEAKQTQWMVEVARAHLKLGEIEQARHVLVRTLRRDPEQQEAAALLARLSKR